MKNFKRFISLLLVIAIMSSYCIVSVDAAITYDTITNGMMFNQAMAAAGSAVKSIEFKQDSTLTAADANLTGLYNSIESGSKIHIAYDKTSGAMTVTFKTAKLKLGANGATDLFSYLGTLESIKGLELLDTSSVTSYTSMFMGCFSLKSLDISTFDFSSISSSDSINQMLNFKGTGLVFSCKELTIPEIPSNLDLVNQGGLPFPTANPTYSGKWADASGNTYADPSQAQSPVSKISAAGTYKWEEISPYGIYVQGIPVTDSNKANILSDSGTATVTYDSTKNELTLNNATINYAKSKTAVGPTVNYVAKPLYTAIEYSGSDTLNIVLSGTNTINTIPMKSDSPATYYYGILSSNSFGKSVQDSEFKYSNLSISGTGTLNFTNNVLDADKANITDSSYLAVAAKAKDILIENATITASGYFTNGIVSTNSTTVNDATISSDKITWVLPSGYTVPLNTDALLSSEGTIDIKGVSKVSTACNENTWLSNVVLANGKITIDLSEGGYVKANAAIPIQSVAGVTLGSATIIKTPTSGEIKTDGGYYPSYQATDKSHLNYTEISTKPTYTITFDVDPDSTGEEVTQAVAEGGKINTTKLQSDISSITKTGKHIKEWLISGTTTVVDFANYVVTEAKTLVASWTANTYKIKFDINGGTSGTMSDLDMTYDVANNLTENAFTKTGYTFEGWATTASGSATYADKESVKNLTTTDGDTVTLYAKWTPITYKVQFDTNGGNGQVLPQTMTYDQSKNLTANSFTKTGYTFAGWATTATGSVTYADGASVKNLSDTANDTVTLYAKWTPNAYKIRFNANEGTGNMSDLDMAYDTAKNLSDNLFTREGYSFAGWATSTTGDVAYADKASVINLTSTKDEVFNLYAKWTLNTYNVTFDVDEKVTDGPQAQTISHGGKVEKPNDPEATGYTFGGWYKEAECTNAWNFNTDTVTKATTLYAKWTPETYDITFTVNDGTWAQGYTALDKYTIEDLVTLPTSAHISREGYTFAGWYDNEDFEGNVITTISKGATGDKAFYAKWTLNTYKVTFNTDSKATVEAQTVNHGELSTQPSDPSTSGYVFKGWFEDEDFETPWDFNTPITKDTTIYVKWVKVDSDTPKSDDFSVDDAALEKIAKQFAKESHDVNSSVIVKATVDNNVSKSDKELLESKTDKTLTLFNTSLLLVMDGGAPIDIGDSNDVLVSITYKFDFSKKTNVKTYRVHDGVLDELTETPNEDGEFVKYDKEAGTITVVAMKYSTYAFAYDVVEDSKADTEKKTAENSKEKKETVANTSDNNMIGAFVALSAMSAVAYVSLKKRED